MTVMGHSEEQVTTQVYGHLMDDSFGDTLKVLQSLESGLRQQYLKLAHSTYYQSTVIGSKNCI